MPPDHRQAPLHPRCRCFDSPVTKGWAELGFAVPPDQRPLFTDVPATETSFDAWLRGQPAKEQQETLGPERRRLWLAGEVTLEGFSDQGEVLNLGDLYALYNIPPPEEKAPSVTARKPVKRKKKPAPKPNPSGPLPASLLNPPMAPGEAEPVTVYKGGKFW